MIIYFSDTAGSCREQAAIAQSVVRNIGSVEVTGSIPVSSSEMVENKDFSRKLLFEMSLFFYYPNQ